MNGTAIQVSAIPATPAHGVVVRNPWARHLLTFLMVFGPGLIVMEADNDAGAVSTYIQAGAQYGTHLLWLLVLLLPITYFIQEMVVRLGIATGQGHAGHDLQPVRQMVGPILAGRLTTVAEQKVETAHLGPMRMTPAVRISLLALRGYLMLMMLLLLYHVLGLAGLLGKL